MSEYNEYNEYDKYEHKARNGLLPVGFDRWDIANSSGWNLAHEVVWKDRLPDTFNQWQLATKRGWTVAHQAAMCGKLPADFEQWTLTDYDGLTVAHVAAEYRYLPVSFDQWGLVNKKGKSVLNYILAFESYTDFHAIWVAQKPACRTEADWAVFKIELPEIYSKYAVAEEFYSIDTDLETYLMLFLL
jgi:hypothetical protein